MFTNKEQLCQSFWQSVKEQKLNAIKNRGGCQFDPPPPLPRLLGLKVKNPGICLDFLMMEREDCLRTVILWVNEPMSHLQVKWFFKKQVSSTWTVLCSFVSFILLCVSSVTRLRQEGFANWKVKTAAIYIELLGLLIRALVFFKKTLGSDNITQTRCC